MHVVPRTPDSSVVSHFRAFDYLVLDLSNALAAHMKPFPQGLQCHGLTMQPEAHPHDRSIASARSSDARPQQLNADSLDGVVTRADLLSAEGEILDAGPVAFESPTCEFEYTARPQYRSRCLLQPRAVDAREDIQHTRGWLLSGIMVERAAGDGRPGLQNLLVAFGCRPSGPRGRPPFRIVDVEGQVGILRPVGGLAENWVAANRGVRAFDGPVECPGGTFTEFRPRPVPQLLVTGELLLGCEQFPDLS